jgi:hypothetical protein
VLKSKAVSVLPRTRVSGFALSAQTLSLLPSASMALCSSSFRTIELSTLYQKPRERLFWVKTDDDERSHIDWRLNYGQVMICRDRLNYPLPRKLSSRSLDSCNLSLSL